MNHRTSRTLNVARWRQSTLFSGFLTLLVLLALAALAFPASATSGSHHSSSTTSPEASSLELTFTGNDRVIVKVSISEPTSGYRRWGVIYRNDDLIATAVVGENYYRDMGLELGQSFVYKLFVYTQDEDTGAITTLGPYTTPSTTTGQVHGDVPFDMTWEGGTWNLTGWVTVFEGVTLTIKPGTTVIGVGDYGTSFHVQGGYLDVSGAMLEALWVEQDAVDHYGNVSIMDSVLDSVVIFADGLDFSRNRGQNCTIWNYYNTGKWEAHYTENVFTASQFNISFAWAYFVSDPGRRPAITIENNDFDVLGIDTGYFESTLNRAWVKVQNNEVAQGIYVTGKTAERRLAGNIYIENNYTRVIDVEFTHFPQIYDNTVVGDGGPNYGIFLGSDVDYALVDRNTLRQANITFKQSSSPPPRHGHFEKNIAPGGWLNLWYGEHNVFVDNAFKGVVAPPGSLANTWNRISPEQGPNVVGGPQKGGNWYSNYAGVDANGDGFGDTPHVIATGNVDQYPLVMDNPGPDLAVDAFQFSQQDVTLSFDRRYILPVDVTVANDGWLPASDVPVVFYGNGDLIETQTIPTLAVGGSPAALHLNWDITPLLIQGNGQADLTLEVIADPDDEFGDPIRSNNQRSYSLHVDGRPKPKFQTSIPLEGYFVHGTSVPNLFSVDIDWNGAFSGTTSAPFGDAWFDLNGTLTSAPGQDWGAAKTYDMGMDFLSSQGCGNNTLQIWASHPVAGGNLNSPKSVFQPTVLPYPDWVEWAQSNIPGSDAALTVSANPFYVEYGYSFPFPHPALEALWTPPANVPYLGGHPLGLASSRATVDVTTLSTGVGNVAVTGTISYSLAAHAAPGTLSGAGRSNLSCVGGEIPLWAKLGMDIRTSVTAGQVLGQVVPGAAAAAAGPVNGRYMDWLVNTTQVPATFYPNVDIQAEFRAQDGQLAFVPSTATAPVTTHVSLATQPAPGLLATVYGGGQISTTLQFPAAPNYLEQTLISLYFEARLQDGPFTSVYTYGVDCLYPGDCLETEIAGQPSAPAWQLAPRDYGHNYAVSAGVTRAPAAETVLVSNAYPYAEPALALRDDGQRLLAYVHDDIAKPQGRGSEIRILRHAGTWSASVSVTDDQQPDYAPALAYDQDGDGLLVWERSALAPGIIPTLDVTYARSLEIAYVTFSGASWSAPALLTNDSLMDRAPRLARAAADGSVLALWETSAGHDTLGTATYPLTLTYATWDGAAWSAPAPAVSGLQDVVHVAVASNSAAEAALVYVVDGDGVLSTTDTDLYYSTFDGAAWSAPTLIADGAGLADSSPALAYDSDGGRHLLWLRDGDLVWLENSWDLGDVELVRAGSTTGGWLGFSLAPGDDGNLALLWQTLDGNGTNLAALVYDSAANLWSVDRPLTADAAVEAYPTPALADGTLYAAYSRTSTELVPRSFEVAPGDWVTVTVPQPGASDLVFLDRDLDRDLTFDSLTITPANPAPGQAVTVTAQLRNAGDLAVAAPQVAFYDGPTAIGTVSLSDALGGGQSVPVEIPWTVPATPAASHYLKSIADPSALLSETDEGNNDVELVTTLPDLDVHLFHTSHQTGELTLSTVLVNAGAVDVVQPFTVTFRVGDPYTGTLAGLAWVNTTVPADGGITLTHTLTDLLPLAGQGDTLWVIADAGAAVLEVDEDNNSGYASFDVLPDLVLEAEDIQGAGPVSILVHNEGVFTATNVSLAVRQGGPGGSLVYSGVLGDLAVGDSQVVEFMLPTGQIELWAQADPDNAIAELDEGNNLAIRSLHIAYWIHLPLVSK